MQGIPWFHKEGHIGDDVDTINGESAVMGQKYQFPAEGWKKVTIHTHTHTYIHTYTYIHTHIHGSTSSPPRDGRRSLYTHTHTYIHTHIYIHTYTEVPVLRGGMEKGLCIYTHIFIIVR